LTREDLEIEIPQRVIRGSKLDNVGYVLKDLLTIKYRKTIKCIGYEEINDGYIFNFEVSMDNISQ
jgi:hypothetical protein